MVHDLTIVTGGATSGKSAFAEGLVVARALPKTYIATAHAWDEEMRAQDRRPSRLPLRLGDGGGSDRPLRRRSGAWMPAPPC